jgi:hypothetical protein
VAHGLAILLPYFTANARRCLEAAVPTISSRLAGAVEGA